MFKNKTHIPEDKGLPPSAAASGRAIFTVCSLGTGGRAPEEGPDSVAAGLKDRGTRWQDGTVRPGTEPSPSWRWVWRGNGSVVKVCGEPVGSEPELGAPSAPGPAGVTAERGT